MSVMSAVDYARVFGTCGNCDKPRVSYSWCVDCNVEYFEENFKNWSSDDPRIDNMIKNTQKTAKEYIGYVEWIDISKFELLKNTGKRGAFSSTYSAVWMEGPQHKWDEYAEVWIRKGPTDVILRRLDRSWDLTDEFIDRLNKYARFLSDNAFAECFGLTKDETSCIMLVYKHYNKGDLYTFFDNYDEFFGWGEIVEILSTISAGIYRIHELGLVHGNLHGGNIMIENDGVMLDARITDAGLHGPYDVYSEDIHGVVPFVAPEVLKGSKTTQASDIYSFGMIMWVLSAGVRPYHHRPHDRVLINEIIGGLRPRPVKDTPPLYARLMERCLRENPLERPLISELYDLTEKWAGATCNYPEPSEITEEFDKADMAKFDEIKYRHTFIHHRAVYHSRNLRTI
ncbi:kinase-like domain-containing protein [Rhizophagus clarus]|nr:kinase-like domain-containing protein [Rhizophagus clarus]